MTRKRFYLYLSTALLSAAFMAYNAYYIVLPRLTSSTQNQNSANVKTETPSKNMSPTPLSNKERVKDIKVANSPSPNWKDQLEKTLKNQGGPTLKEVILKKVDSFVFAQDGIPLYVESVLVTLKRDKNASTSFRVLVDAETGKILRSWDQPVFDSANPRNNFRIKIDPRNYTE